MVSGASLDRSSIPPLPADGQAGRTDGERARRNPQDAARFRDLAGDDVGGAGSNRTRGTDLVGGVARAPVGGTTSPSDSSGGDSVRISPQARALLEQEAANDEDGGAAERSPTGRDLTPEEQEQVRELSARDTEVRQHEQAHLAAAGDLASGGPTYTYQTGPDGQRYAIGGEVQIQLREGEEPQETLDNARQAKRAALAPAEPSTQDRRVAAQADALALRAQREIAEERRTEGQPDGEESTGATALAAPVADGSEDASASESDATASGRDGRAEDRATRSNDSGTRGTFAGTTPDTDAPGPDLPRLDLLI